jgi:hypothetical protein
VKNAVRIELYRYFTIEKPDGNQVVSPFFLLIGAERENHNGVMEYAYRLADFIPETVIANPNDYSYVLTNWAGVNSSVIYAWDLINSGYYLRDTEMVYFPSAENEVGLRFGNVVKITIRD